jgi:hypothetical protein
MPQDPPPSSPLEQLHALRRLMRHEAAPVLQLLNNTFPADRPRYTPDTGYDPIKAAVSDGQSQVTRYLNSILHATDAELKAIAENAH